MKIKFGYSEIFLTLFLIMLVWDVIMPSNLMVIVLFTATLLPLLATQKRPSGLGNINVSVVIGLYLLAVTLIHYTSSLKFSDEMFNENFTNIFLSLQLIWIIPFLFNNFKDSFLKAIDYGIFLLAAIFVIQYFTYYLLGSYFDVLHMFGGKASKYQAYSGLNLSVSNLIRPTSIFNEPGTYCSYSFILLMLSYLNHKRVKPIHIFVLVTFLLSLSAFGLIIASLSLLLLLIKEISRRRKEKKSVLLYGILLTPFIYGLFKFLKKYFLLRFIEGRNQGGAELRFDTMQVYFSNSFDDRMFGLTFGFNQIEKFHVQDASLLFSIFLFFGLFAIPFILLIFKHFRYNFQLLIIFIIIGLTKIDFTSFCYWLFIIAAPLVYFQNTKQNEYEK